VSIDFRYRRRVQFYETDLAGIVHFSWYFRYFEEAEHALWRARGLTIADPDSDVRFPRVQATCEFLAPLRFENEVDVVLRIEQLGRRTIRYAGTILCGQTIAATGTMTVICVRERPAPMQAIDIPEDVRTALE
jgi:YbgC/YbaW family acyl-CoA thioester hydrolase